MTHPARPLRLASAIAILLAATPTAWAQDAAKPTQDEAVRLFEAACFVLAPNFAAAPAVLTSNGLTKAGDGYFRDATGTLRAALVADDLDRLRHCGIAFSGADADAFVDEMARLVKQRWADEATALPTSEKTLEGFQVDAPGFEGSLTYLVQPLGDAVVLGVIAAAPMGFHR